MNIEIYWYTLSSSGDSILKLLIENGYTAIGSIDPDTNTDYRPSCFYMISPCSSPDSEPSYDILHLADAADVLVANSIPQNIASDVC